MVLGSVGSLLAQRNPSGGGGLAPLLLLVVMGLFFYFLLIRPQQRRTRQQRMLIESIEVGDEVLTIGGIFGTVRRLNDDRVTIEVSPGMDLQFARSAIARRLEAPDESYNDEDQAEEEERDAGGSS
jgi:preprotein translocase subunit YajC